MKVAFATEVWCNDRTNAMEPTASASAAATPPPPASRGKAAIRRPGWRSAMISVSVRASASEADQHDLPGARRLDQADQQAADAPERPTGERHQDDAAGVVRIDARPDLRPEAGGADPKVCRKRLAAGSGVLELASMRTIEVRRTAACP